MKVGRLLQLHFQGTPLADRLLTVPDPRRHVRYSRRLLTRHLCPHRPGPATAGLRVQLQLV